MKDIKKNIYIVHQYLEKSHFKALYDCAEKYNYIIKGFIVLEKRDMCRRLKNDIVKNKEFFKPIKRFLGELLNLLKLRFLKNEILIVGIAPYDRLLNRYHRIFKNNKSIYFTSWQFWDGTNFPRGNLSNRNRYEELLRISFKGVACVSKVTALSMKKFFKNIEVVNHAITTNEYRSKEFKITNNIKRYIYLGQLIERKNISLIIDWINNNKSLNFQFDFAGSGNLEKEIVELAANDERVRFLGKLTKLEIKNMLNNYDYMVLPSKEEPFGIVLIEALAAGVPCIVSDALGPSEIITDERNGFIFDREDKVMFDNIMNKSLGICKEKYREISENSLKDSKQYDSENLVKKWINVIEN